MPGGEIPPAGPPGFTSGEKIASVLDVVLTGEPSDPKARAVLSTIRTARRFRLLGPVLEAFPPLEDPAAWDQWLALAAGVALNLISDGVDVDLEAARAVGADVLAQLFAEEGAPGGA
jgi:hypothetical protein